MKKALAFVLAVMLALSGCGGQSSSSAAGGESSVAEGERVPKDTLIIAQSAESTTMDPHEGKDAASVCVHRHIFDTLVSFDADMNIVPAAAESWEILSNTSTQFNLRTDMKFHNGDPMTAEDVKFSLERAMNTPAISALVGFIDNVEIVDDHTIIVNSAEPFAPVLSNLAYPAVAIVDKAVVEELGDDAFTNPIGTGPYKFVEWNHGENIKLTANPDYYKGEPATKNLLFRVIPEGAQRTIGLETGELDLSYGILPNDMEKITSNSDLALYETSGMSVTYLMLNNQKDILKDVRVRQALRYAINIDEIVDVIVSGAGTPAPNMIAPGVFGYDDELSVYEYNPEKAKELLAEANFPTDTVLTVMTAENQTRSEILQVIQSQLEEVGVKIEIQSMEYGVFYDAIANGEHDIAIFGFVTSTGDADYAFSSLYHSDSHGINGNRAFYTNTHVDELIDSARATVDSDERLALYKEVQEIVYDECPYIPLFIQNVVVGANKNVEGFKPYPTDYHDLYNVVCYE